MTYLRNDALVHSLEQDLVLRSEVRLAETVSEFLLLPGLRGLWSMGSIGANGEVFDLSGNLRTLTRQGVTSTYRYLYLNPRFQNELGGASWLYRADEAGLDITGTETYVAAAVRGLTWGGWFQFVSVPASDEGLITKWDTTGNQRSYRLFGANPSNIECEISSNGIAATNVAAAGFTTIAVRWYFVVGRFIPSTELALFIQGTRLKFTNVAAIPASIFNSTSQLQVMAENAGTDRLRGRCGICFLCATALEDGVIDQLFHKSVVLFDKDFVA